jgi:HAE1 family hydrophobic/amphiphilic exporter-1
VIQINAYLAKSTAGVVQGELEEKLSKVGFPAGYGYQFVGNAEAQEETGKEIAKAFLLAVILTYMLLAAVMNSFVHPFTISISIFTSYAGVFIGLFFLDSSINIASMLGFVMMVGLAVNNAILILEEVQFLLQKDPQLNIKQALWQGTQNKFRAVLMTSIAVVFGVLPQVWSPDLPKASMGIVVAGGMVSSIFFTLFLTPLIYWYFERIRRWTKGDDGGGIFLTDNGSQTSQSNENSIPADPLIEPTSPSAGSVDMLNVAKIQPS